jgi:light-regulated signal transduction histidine kinase (bacteriophytochrome)
MVTINYVQYDEQKTVKPVAYAGFGEDYIRKLKISWGDNKYSQGPTGRAIRTGKPAIAGNIREDPGFKIWRTFALKSGYVAGMAIPLYEDGKIFGTLNIYSNKLNPFSQDEINLLQELANDLSLGIRAIRNRESLKQNQEELKHLSDELRRSNQELENFADIISHDLREPLRAVSGFIELLQIKYKDKLDEKAKEYIELAINGSKNMRNMINGLLQYSRVQSEGSEFSNVSIEECLKTALENLRTSISENEVEITSDALPIIKADSAQIIQLLQNLIQNGIKYKSNRKPKIHIGCVKENKHWMFSVRDNGIGIEKQDYERIFTILKESIPKANRVRA